MEKICIKNMSVKHSFEKNETATMFFLKKSSLVERADILKTVPDSHIVKIGSHNEVFIWQPYL